MKYLISILILLCGLIAMPNAALAEAKHPRVSELEGYLTQKIQEILRSRFPDQPFLATVEIEPIFRYEKDSVAKGEKLPYFELDEEEVRDEWDDPGLSSTYLLGRVKKISAQVSVSASLKDEDVKEVEKAIFSSIHLIAGRDELNIQKKVWTADTEKSNYWIYFSVAAAGIILLLMVGLFIVSWYAVNKMSKALKESRSSSKGAEHSPQVIAMPETRGFAQDPNGQNTTNISGDFKFTDPIKTREVVNNAIKILTGNKSFPELEDMLTLDRFGETDPGSLGALLSCFPIAMQKMIFALSYKDHWLDAFNAPKEINSAAMDVLNRLVQGMRRETDKDWQVLLINIWRLDNKRGDFLKTLKQEEAFSILHHLPKSIAMVTAREAFPGSWGQLLDSRYCPAKISQDRTIEISKASLKEKPLRSFTQIELYRQERELIEYLKTVAPQVEKEIYIAAPEDSIIHRIRPPFYQILELNEEEFARYVHTVKIEDWALALFDLPKTARKSVERYFTDKQRFLLIERLKYLDARAPDKRTIGQMREHVARVIFEAINRQQQISLLKEDEHLSDAA